MLKVIISGGGTGGHIFPALSIANALKEKYKAVDILFVGAVGKMEMEKVPQAGYKIIGLNITGIKRSLSLSNLLFPFRLIGSVLKAKKIIKEFQPDVAVGVGGFASGPLLYAASGSKVPCLIQEQNSYPGITNKWLSTKADRICVAYDNMERFFPKDKIRFTGNPIRRDMIDLRGKAERAYEMFGLNPQKPLVFITGGSLGAKSINECILANINRFIENDIQLIWQTGKMFFPQVERLKADLKSKGVFITDFISHMDYAYSIADLVVSRAGAGAVSELCVVGCPCILVPYPFAAEDHQTKNAEALVNSGAAILIADNQVGARLTDEVLALVSDNDKLQRLRKNLLNLGITDAADVIADEVFNLSLKSKNK
jgi:UDP-N-acetylglucosamine--N-acetylmuramyl-(pentapeptide) pyrophosphoryl-undecaprenol N-acetylglucosamine transferase